MQLNYQELVKGYYENLNTNLRNFRGGPGFLETWVHDEDHNRSLIEILDLAQEHGVDDLVIELPSDVLPTINVDWLRKSARKFGSVDLQNGQLLFRTALQAFEEGTFDGVNDAYRAALQRQSADLNFEGPLEKSSSKIFSASDEGTLRVEVDEKGVVTQARHEGFRGADRPLFDAFCAVLKGRSLQEGAEHGTIRLETLLRSPQAAAPIRGLITAENADPIFKKPTALIRKIFAEASAGQKFERNFWRDPVPEAWLSLSESERLNRAQELILQGSKHFGLQENVLVVEIKNNTRFVLSYSQDKNFPDFGRTMIRLERWLRALLSFEVELQLESIEDRNKRVTRTKR